MTDAAQGDRRTTTQLAKLCSDAIPFAEQRKSKIHPATRTFQALRIAVNRELDGLDQFVDQACARLAPRGRLAVIAFHSLEDRVVKHTLRELAADGSRSLRLLARKAARPTEPEVEMNPRARSARLRAVERVA
jgi:16S rRNA (cytosine1402-N4)-methyltransferase